MSSSTSFSISQEAFLKSLLHIFKHPSSQINGVLVGSTSSPSSNPSSNGDKEPPLSLDANGARVRVVDAIPLSHSRLTLLPLLELALLQIDEHFSKEGLSIIGFYSANERFDDTELSGFARKVGDQIAKHFPYPLLLLVDARQMTRFGDRGEEVIGSGRPESTFKVYTHDSMKGWRFRKEEGVSSLENPNAESLLKEFLKEGRQNNVFDFEDHLEDVSRDWLNAAIFA